MRGERSTGTKDRPVRQLLRPSPRVHGRRGPASLATASSRARLTKHLLTPLDILDDDEYTTLKTSLLQRGYGGAAACVAVAVVANHIRRVLVPWVGHSVWRHAVTDMKLARSAPHALLEASLLEFCWTEVGRWAGQRAALSLARAVMVRRDADTRWQLAQFDESKGERASDVSCVLRLLTGLTRLEGQYTESCWAIAHIYATTRLLLSARPCDGNFLRHLVLESTPRARLALQAVLLLRWLCGRLTAMKRRPRRVLLAGCACGVGTVHVLRNSGRYFILLEMSDMLVTFAWMALGIVVLMAWAVCAWARNTLRRFSDGYARLLAPEASR